MKVLAKVNLLTISKCFKNSSGNLLIFQASDVIEKFPETEDYNKVKIFPHFFGLLRRFRRKFINFVKERLHI